MDRERIVRLHNNGKKFEGKWDGKPIEIAKGKHVEVPYGVAEHLAQQSEDLEIKEIEEEEPEPREPENPVDEDRGEAFAQLRGDSE